MTATNSRSTAKFVSLLTTLLVMASIVAILKYKPSATSPSPDHATAKSSSTQMKTLHQHTCSGSCRDCDCNTDDKCSRGECKNVFVNHDRCMKLGDWNKYTVSYRGSSYDSINDLTTFSYEVCQQNWAKDISHWALGICDTSRLHSTTPYLTEEVNRDPRTGIKGIKWDRTQTSQCKHYGVTFTGSFSPLHIKDIHYTIKAGRKCYYEVVKGPIFPTSDCADDPVPDCPQPCVNGECKPPVPQAGPVFDDSSIDRSAIYRLNNHPDGSARPPLYGLRLDHLLPGCSRVVTFDFEYNTTTDQSAMYLSWNPSTKKVHIYGVAFGGPDSGSNYDSGYPHKFSIDFTYSNVQVRGSSGNRYLYVPYQSCDKGWIRDEDTSTMWNMVSSAMSGSYFKLKTGHRGVSTYSGYGWVDHSDVAHQEFSDWLFTIDTEYLLSDHSQCDCAPGWEGETCNEPELSQICGYVYDDVNANAVKDSQEPGLANVQLTLKGTDMHGATVSKGAITNTTGGYCFRDLVPGTYDVIEQQPPQYLDGRETPCGGGSIATNDKISGIDIEGGQIVTHCDFGECNGAITITCPARSTIAQTTSERSCSASVDFPEATVSSTCQTSYNITQSITSATYPKGHHTVNVDYHVRYNGDQIKSKACPFDVTVSDDENPEVICPVDMTANARPGICAQIVNYPDVSVTDNCGATVTLESGLASGEEFPYGETVVTYKATDSSGNDATCSFTVTVADPEPPTITCPADISVFSGNRPSMAVHYPAPVANDNCPGVTVTLESGKHSGEEFSLGVTTQVYKATDAQGASVSCNFTVTVFSSEDPEILCPTSLRVTQSTDPGICTTNVTIPPAELVNVGNNPPALTQNDSWAVLGPGNYDRVVRYSAIVDGEVITRDCCFLLVVTDDEKPNIVCTERKTAPMEDGKCTAKVDFEVTATDNCGVTVTQACGVPPGSDLPKGVTTNSYIAVDDSGNAASCSSCISVRDEQPPTITCPSDLDVPTDPDVCSAVVTYDAPVTQDNCPGEQVVQVEGRASGSRFLIGSSWQTFAVSDGSGNCANCSFTVKVTDQQPPTITCPSNLDLVISNKPGKCHAYADFPAADVVDNCASVCNTTQNTTSLKVVKGTNMVPVEYCATDYAGNTGCKTCTFTVTVQDTENPSVSCPANVQLEQDGTTCQASYNYQVGFSDNCPGAVVDQYSGLASGSSFLVGLTTNAFVVTDTSGNTARCNFTVSVTDTLAPWIQQPSPLSISATPNNCAAEVTIPCTTAQDNCDNAVPVTQNVTAVTVTEDSQVPVEYCSTDSNGNQKCQVFVFDITLPSSQPTLSCPTSPITVVRDTASCGTKVHYSVNASAGCGDNSVSPVLKQGLPSGSEFSLGTTTVIYEVDVDGQHLSCSFDVIVENPSNNNACNDHNCNTNNDVCRVFGQQDGVAQAQCLGDIDSSCNLHDSPYSVTYLGSSSANGGRRRFKWKVCNPGGKGVKDISHIVIGICTPFDFTRVRPKTVKGVYSDPDPRTGVTGFKFDDLEQDACCTTYSFDSRQLSGCVSEASLVWTIKAGRTCWAGLTSGPRV